MIMIMMLLMSSAIFRLTHTTVVNNNNVHTNNNEDGCSWVAFETSKSSITIAQFTDLHYGEGENVVWGPVQDVNSTECITSVLGYESGVDLCAFTGDLITGNNIGSDANKKNNATAYWAEALSPVLQKPLPFFTVFGNHDDLSTGTGGTKMDLVRQESTLAQAHGTQSFTFNGSTSTCANETVGNYVIPVHFNTVLKLVLFVMDSGGGQEKSNGITPIQVAWFVEQRRRYPSEIPALLFVHIPLPVYETAFERFQTNFTQQCWGMEKEGGGAVMENGDSGLFDALATTATPINLITVGHNHGNAWCCPWNGVTICFGRHTGFGGYSEDGNQLVRGARLFKFTPPNTTTLTTTPASKGTLETWIRLEHGDVEDMKMIPL
eukprot:m.262660 g.262660  ORF g.262660 m.262660 type:complete len:378 (-) comp46571_c0_seq1:52-1185(-)